MRRMVVTDIGYSFRNPTRKPCRWIGRHILEARDDGARRLDVPPLRQHRRDECGPEPVRSGVDFDKLSSPISETACMCRHYRSDARSPHFVSDGTRSVFGERWCFRRDKLSFRSDIRASGCLRSPPLVDFLTFDQVFAALQLGEIGPVRRKIKAAVRP
jgi:hypothetical protein